MTNEEREHLHFCMSQPDARHWLDDISYCHTKPVLRSLKIIDRHDPIRKIEGRSKNSRIAFLPFSVYCKSGKILGKPISHLHDYAKELLASYEQAISRDKLKKNLAW